MTATATERAVSWRDRVRHALVRGRTVIEGWGDRPLRLLVVAFAIRFGLAVVLFGTDLVPHNGWYFRNEDQGYYYSAAYALVHGELAPYYQTIGYPFLLTPFAAVTDWVFQAIPPVAIVQGLLAIPAAFLLYRAGSALLDRRSAAVGAALWVASPLLAGLLFGSVGPLFVEGYGFWWIQAPGWLGLSIGPDYASMLLAIAVLAVAAPLRDDGSARRGLLVGVVVGLALLVKPTNVILLASVLAALAAWRRGRAALVTVAAALVVFSPQLVLNDRLFGSPTSFGYTPSVAARELPPYYESLTRGTFSLEHIPRAYGKLMLSNYAGPLLFVGIGVALVVAWRRFPSARWLVVAPVVAFGLAVGSYYYAIDSTYLRLIMPALPALFLAAGGALVGRATSPQPVARRAPGFLPCVLAGIAVVAAVVVAVWFERAPPASLDTTVFALSRTTVDPALTPSVRVDGPDVELAWREPSGPAEPAYYVLRNTAAQPAASTARRGFHWRGAPGGTPFVVPRGETSFIDRPGPGTWWYRVVVAPGHLPGGWPPEATASASPPVRAVVGSP